MVNEKIGKNIAAANWPYMWENLRWVHSHLSTCTAHVFLEICAAELKEVSASGGESALFADATPPPPLHMRIDHRVCFERTECFIGAPREESALARYVCALLRKMRRRKCRSSARRWKEKLELRADAKGDARTRAAENQSQAKSSDTSHNGHDFGDAADTPLTVMLPSIIQSQKATKKVFFNKMLNVVIFYGAFCLIFIF